MFSRMLLQMARGFKGLPTVVKLAAIGPLARVYPNVRGEVCLFRKGLAAARVGTYEGSFSRLHSRQRITWERSWMRNRASRV